MDDAWTTHITAGTVHMWQVPLTAPVNGPAAAARTALLSDDERHRFRAAGSQRSRAAFLHSRVALRSVLGCALALPPAELRFVHGPWGKPELAAPHRGLRFSLSHSGDVALLAVTRGRAVGVDVELCSRHRAAARLARRYFPGDEALLVQEAHQARGTCAGAAVFCRLWTRKEACVKAAGGRLAQGLRLPVAAGGPDRQVHDPSGALPGIWTVGDVDVPDGYTAAVAVAGTAPYRVISHTWRGQELLDEGDEVDEGSGAGSRC